MGAERPGYPVGRILIAGLIIVLLTVLIVTLVVTGYAISLGIEARGAPDQARIDQFAARIGSILAPILAIMLTFLGAGWIRKKVPAAPILSGLVLGILVVILSLLADMAFGTELGAIDVLWYALVVAAGWLGGRPRT
jgi:hypothetical protein